MPASARRGPLLGAFAAVLISAAARADGPDPTAVQPIYPIYSPQAVDGSSQQPADGTQPVDLGQAAVGDDVRNWSISLTYGYETFRGVSDGNWQNNGLNTGFNFGTQLGQFSDLTGIGFQVGGSIGIYNWSGTDYRIMDDDEAQTQGFITTGFFRKATAESPWDAAIVFDWMINNNFGVYNASPTLNQWRFHLGYDVNDCNEIGVWGAVRGANLDPRGCLRRPGFVASRRPDQRLFPPQVGIRRAIPRSGSARRWAAAWRTVRASVRSLPALAATCR